MRLSEEVIPALILDEPKPDVAGNSSVADNHIYFYEGINDVTALHLIENLRKVDTQLRTQRLVMGIPDDWPMIPIWLHISSPGGLVDSSFAIADTISRIKSPTYSVVEGMAASGATLVSMSCAQRYITPNSFVLIHQLSGALWGTYEEQKDGMKLHDMMMERIVNFYVARSNMSVKRIGKILKHDSWFGAGECLELGIVDEIL